MQPQLVRIAGNPEVSIQVRRDLRDNFYSVWHYHPEFELCLIVKSTGTRFVGDSVEQFGEGDLVLVGSNVPHVWKNSDDYYQPGSKLQAEAVVIHFSYDFAGIGFFNLPEMKPIRKLLEEANRGFQFTGVAGRELSQTVLEMVDATPFDRVLMLTVLLNRMAASTEWRKLSSEGYTYRTDSNGADKLNVVFAYIIENFRREITLESVSAVANMTPTAFCRFFRSRTRKTFTTYLNEIRISFACRLLMENRLDVSQAALESGFNNLSYFNRQFLKQKGETPSSYRIHHTLNR